MPLPCLKILTLPSWIFVYRQAFSATHILTSCFDKSTAHRRVNIAVYIGTNINIEQIDINYVVEISYIL